MAQPRHFPPNSDDAKSGKKPAGVRLQRVLAEAGVAARRACEELIERGHVKVNGRTVTKLPAFVDPESDKIEVDGRPLPKPEHHIYVMLHKPPRALATTKDEESIGRVTVMDFVDHPAAARLYPVGRLDFETSGILLLTNDGELAHQLTHPKFQIPKTYLATIRGSVDEAYLLDVWKKLRSIERQQEREDQDQRPGLRPRRDLRAALKPFQKVERMLRGREPSRPHFHIVESTPEQSQVRMTLVEGKTGPLDEALRILGTPLKKLVRVAFGPVQLAGLPLARWRELRKDELLALRKAVEGKGPKAPVWEDESQEGEKPARRAPVRRESSRAREAREQRERLRRIAEDRRPPRDAETRRPIRPTRDARDPRAIDIRRPKREGDTRRPPRPNRREGFRP